MKSFEMNSGSIAAGELLNLIQQPAVLLSSAGDISYCNLAFNNLFSSEMAELLHENLLKFVDQREGASINDYLANDKNIGFTYGDHSIKLTIRQLTTTNDANTTFIGLCDINQELNEVKASEKRLQMALEHESRHDPLTGLANRRKLVEDQDAIFENASNSEEAPAYAVMRIDLDRFKQVNDNYGHAAGDAVLVHVSEIFTQVVGDKGSVARMGGDEFSILLTRERREREFLKIAEQILAEVAKPFYFEGAALQFGINIGIASSECQGADPAQTQINAEQALYDAKESAPNCIRFFTERFIDEEEYYGT